MKKRLLSLICLLLCLCTALCGCTTYDNFRASLKPAEPVKGLVRGPVKIGVFEPLTGNDSVEAAAELEGIELAHAMFPEVLGRTVELIYADNQSDPAAAVEAAESLMEQGVCAVLGSYKNVLSLAAGDVFAEHEIPAIAATCTNPLITQTNPFYARVCFIDAYQGRSAAEYVAAGLKLNKIAVLHRAGDDLAAAMIEEFRAELTERLGTDMEYTYVQLPEGEEDCRPYLERLAQSGAQCVFFPSSAAAADAVLREADALGYSFTWIGTSQWEDLLNGGTGNVLAQAANAQDADKSYLNGIAYVSAFDADTGLTTVAERFLEAYREKHGEDAVPSANVALGFDAYLLAITAIGAAQSDLVPEFIMNQITRVSGMEGASGIITMDAQGDPTRSVAIEMIIEDQPLAVYATALRSANTDR